MMTLMMKWMPSCREIAGMLAHNDLGAISWPKRLLVRMHLSMCTFCARFARQMRLLEKAFRDRWAQKPSAEKLSAMRRRLLERLSR